MAARVIIEARAAVCSSTCGCCCKPNIKTSGTRCYRRLISTGNSPLQESYQQNDGTASEPQIPLVPKYRDPHAVLKALSSTVTPMQFIMAEEAGKKAAEYVISRYPHLFPWKQPIPMYVPHEWVYELMFRLCTDTKRPDVAMMLWKDMVQYRVEITKPEVLQRAVGALGVSANIDPQESPKFIAAVDHIWVKMLYNEWRPSEFMISVAVKMCAYNNQLDKAWEYYSLFKEYGQKPTFVALSSLLKAHIAKGDIDKVTELLDKIISLGFWFPRNFIISICSSLGVSPEEKDRFLEGFEQNWSSRQDSDMYSSNGTEGRDDS